MDEVDKDIKVPSEVEWDMQWNLTITKRNCQINRKHLNWPIIKQEKISVRFMEEESWQYSFSEL